MKMLEILGGDLAPLHGARVVFGGTDGEHQTVTLLSEYRVGIPSWALLVKVDCPGYHSHIGAVRPTADLTVALKPRLGAYGPWDRYAPRPR